jgi:hypothetical protein
LLGSKEEVKVDAYRKLADMFLSIDDLARVIDFKKGSALDSVAEIVEVLNRAKP